MIRARRDTIALVVGATAATFALSGAIHGRPDRLGAKIEAKTALGRDWTGALAAMAPDASQAQDPISSASLVVPKADFALPAMPVRPLVKLRGCEDLNCVAKAAPAQPKRNPAAVAELNRVARHGAQLDRPTLMSRLNPLKHLPDMSMIRRPFAYAGDTLTGWFRRD